MKKIKFGMFSKISITFSLVSIFIFSLSLLITIQKSRKAFESQSYRDTTALIMRTDKYLDMYLQNIKNILFFLSEMDDTYIADKKALERILRDAESTNPGIIGGIYLITGNLDIISSKQTIYEIIGHPKLISFRDMISDNSRNMFWTEPYYSPIIGGKTVAFLRPDYVENSKPNLFVIEVDLSYLAAHMTEVLSGRSQSFIIITRQGNLLAMDSQSALIEYDVKEFPQDIDNEFMASLRQSNKGFSNLKYNDKRILVVRSGRNSLGWDLLVLIDESVFRSNINSLLVNFAVIGVMSTCLLLAVIILLSRHFTLPIRSLAEKMDKVRSISKVNIEKIKRGDEIGLLHNSFFLMIRRINDMQAKQEKINEKRRETEFKLLQSQIRPHFLGNTLACLSSLVKQGRTEETIEMIRALILLFNFSTNKIGDFPYLEAEIETLSSYLKIQKMRYGDNLKYSISVPDDLLNCTIPKMLIEPLVENAIIHGLADKREGGFIEIICAQYNRELHIVVRDNGEGMSTERLAVVQEMLRRKGKHGTETGRFSSIGLKNVQDRIRLYYGSRYGITINSSPREGTEVKIRIPFTV